MCFLPLLVNSQKNLKVCKGKLRESGKKVADGSLKGIFEENEEKRSQNMAAKKIFLLREVRFGCSVTHEAAFVGISGVLLVLHSFLCNRGNYKKNSKPGIQR